jgi:hypothetical protein
MEIKDAKYLRLMRSNLAVLAVLLLVVAGCGSTGAPGTSRSVGNRTARVFGTARACNCVGHPKHCWNLTGHVSASAFSGRVAATHGVTEGHYSFLLLPGRYRLSLYSGGRPVFDRLVRAEANRSIRVNFAFAGVGAC